MCTHHRLPSSRDVCTLTAVTVLLFVVLLFGSGSVVPRGLADAARFVCDAPLRRPSLLRVSAPSALLPCSLPPAPSPALTPSSFGATSPFPPHARSVFFTAATSAVAAPLVFAAAQATVPQAIICLSITKNRERRTQHAAFAVDYYRAAYPNVNFTVKPVGVYEATGTTPQGLGRAMINDGTDCTAFIGPGSSSISQSINVLVQQVWMCFSATSTQLSDKKIYSYFSRVVPSDAATAVGAARLMIDFGWRKINSFCTDNTYGQSVTQGIAQSFTALGGTIGITRCVSNSATNASILAALQDFAVAESKVVFATISTSDVYYRTFIDLVVSNGFDKQLIFFFSESACSAAVHQYARIEGSLCATFRIDQSVFSSFHTAYKARDTATTDQWFLDAGYPASFPLDKTGTEVFAAYAVDATRFVMHGLDAYAQSVGATQAAVDFKTTSKILDVVAHTRAQAMPNGVTGPNVTLNSNGDRPSSDMVVYNGQPGGIARVVANVTDTVSVASEIYWLAAGFLSTPPRATPLPPPASNTATVVAAAAAGGAVFLVVVIAVTALVLFTILRPKVRDTSRAPKDGDNITIAFTDIEKSTLLWSLHPMEMAAALDHHHRLIREAIQKYEGYEVKTIGDAFMVAFKAPTNGLLFALDVQDRLFEFDWGTDAFDATYKEKLDYSSEVLATYPNHWNGMRVRIGVHCGKASVDFDEVARGYDYYGPAVNCASRVEALAHGGQVLVSEEVRAKAHAQPECAQWNREHRWTEAVDFKAMGEHEVRGIPDPISVHQVHLGTERYWGRTFPPVRSDHHPQEEEEDDDDPSAELCSDAADLEDPEQLSLDGSFGSGGRTHRRHRTHSHSSQQSGIGPSPMKGLGSPGATKIIDPVSPGLTSAGAGHRLSAAGFSAFAHSAMHNGPAQAVQHAALVSAYRQLPPKAVRHVRSKRGGRLNYAGKMMFAEATTAVTSLLSIMPDKDKIPLVQRLCKAWRVPYDPNAKKGRNFSDSGTIAGTIRGGARRHHDGRSDGGRSFGGKSYVATTESDQDKDKGRVYSAYAEPQLYVLLHKLVRMRQAKASEQAEAARKRTGRSLSNYLTPVTMLDALAQSGQSHHSQGQALGLGAELPSAGFSPGQGDALVSDVCETDAVIIDMASPNGPRGELPLIAVGERPGTEPRPMSSSSLRDV